MSFADAVDMLEAYDLLLVIGGLAALAVAVLPRLLHNKPLSVPMLMVALGFTAFALPLGLDAPDPLAQGAIVKRVTELGVILSLMAVGLTIDRPPGLRAWASTWRLLALTMPLSIIGVALVGGWTGLLPASALLLGAVIAPTDPVLGKDVEVDAPGEGSAGPETETMDPTAAGEEDEVRFALTSEAGLNDGLAFPYTNLAIAIAVAGPNPGSWIGRWLSVDVGYKIAVAIAVGLVVGRAMGVLVLRVPYDSDLSRSATGIAAVAATLIVYGLTEYAGGYGFVATFVGAASIRATNRWHPLHRELQSFAEGTERLLMAGIMIGLGAAIAGGLLAPLDWRHVAGAVVIVLVVRPVAGSVALIGFDRAPWRERAAMSFYGIRGIATFYYLAYALEEAAFPGREVLWGFAGLVVLLSVMVHGATAAPALHKLDALRDQGAAR